MEDRSECRRHRRIHERHHSDNHHYSAKRRSLFHHGTLNSSAKKNGVRWEQSDNLSHSLK